MKVITEPTVVTIAVPRFIEHPEHKIPADGDDFVKLGAFCAKSCYDSFGKNGRSNEDNQRRILTAADGSILEHLNITLFIEGISRGLSLESNRHRFLHPSQRSTRYTKEDGGAIVLEPFYAKLFSKYNPVRVIYSSIHPTWNCTNRGAKNAADAAEVDLLIAFLNHSEDQFIEYNLQVELLMKLNPLKLDGFELRKWARGKARQLLPHSLETKIAYTGSIRSWRHVIAIRSAKNAEPEIRRLANALYTELSVQAPLYFEDFHVTEVYDGIPVLTPDFVKI